jgi:4-diphosphocytidyl-2-C-methyl-D-erythritol kinase
MTLRRAAPAKLNLYLHITGKRADGYHLLDGLVGFADVGDVVTITTAEALSFTVDGPFAAGLEGDSDSNLVVKAARAMAELAGRAPDVALHLTKNLPVASGIGGGSADAAACIRGLAQLWNVDPASAEVLAIAAGLGSDIPVCVAGRAAYIGGVGVDIAPAPELPPAGVLLVNPGIALSTPSVYRARTGGFSPENRFNTPPPDAAALAALLAERGNGLTEAAVSLVPEIDAVLKAIAALPGCLLSRMSGSGATCFGIFGSAEAAATAASVLAPAHARWWIAPGRLVQDASSLPTQ